jgi:formiminotetrahydrofolate cyclodeaminase
MNKMLDLTTRDLLNEFGKGTGMTGAGASAALGAIAATQILLSVCKLTTAKEKYATVHGPLQEIQEQLENKYLAMLEGIMQADAATIENMLRLRSLRDGETDAEKKEILKQQAAKTLEGAAATMLKLCSTCLEIMPMAIQVHDTGLKSAQGDVIMAFSGLLSSASSGLYACLINIRAAKDATWTTKIQEQVHTAYGRLHEYRHIFSGKLEVLYTKTLG